MPADWEGSFIINLYKGKGDALERGNNRGLKLLDHVMKVMLWPIKFHLQKCTKERGRMINKRNIAAAQYKIHNTQLEIVDKEKYLEVTTIQLEKLEEK